MNEATKTNLNKQLYYRLIALWVICESLIGGIIHGFKLPISGLIVGSCSVICICLIAFYIPEKSAIIKATIIVAIFKMMLSPHSPPMAYIAVFFQGILAALLFNHKKYFTIFCILFAVLALAESAVQRIIILWLIYGENFWTAINKSIIKLFPSAAENNYILLIAIVYIIAHCITGILVSFLVLRITKAHQNGKNKQYLIDLKTTENLQLNKTNKTKISVLKIPFIIVWILLIALLVQSTLKIGTPILQEKSILIIFIRAAIILMTWYFLISPVLTRLLKKWLEKQKNKSQTDISAIIQLLPTTRFLFSKSWQLSKNAKGYKRIILASKIIIANTISTHHEI